MENSAQSEQAEQASVAGTQQRNARGMCGLVGGYCCFLLLMSLVTVVLIFFYPSVFSPFPLSTVWGFHVLFTGLLMDALPLFLFGGMAYLVLLIAARRRLLAWLEMPDQVWMPSDLLSSIPHFFYTRNNSARRAHLYRNKYARGCLYVLGGGLLGEITRLFGFYIWIIELYILNYLFFGFAGFGIFQWLFLTIGRPAVDIVTLHLLHPYLYQSSWVIGTAIIISSFPWWPQKEYLKRVIPALLLSWWPGMFFIMLTLKYGLFAAMLVGFIYAIMVQLLVQLLVLRTPLEEAQPAS